MRAVSTTTSVPPASVAPLFREHPRHWHNFTCVYPVISRRSGGLSLGINLNADKLCNFHCAYCMVDRTPLPAVQQPPTPTEIARVDLIRSELDSMIDLVETGEIWNTPPFDATPQPLRRFNDIAFSGDGEPTACQVFDRAVAAVVDVRKTRRLDDVKLVLFTNASLLDRLIVHRGLEMLDRNNGEVWAKLDAGDVNTYRRVNRSDVAYSRILSNLVNCGRRRAIVIQTMLARINGRDIDDEAFDQYARRLVELRARGCRVKSVHLYTVARQAAEAAVSPVSQATLSRYADWLRMMMSDLNVQTFPGVD